MFYSLQTQFRSSNNQGIEGQNKNIKASQTMRKRLPLGSFVDVCLRMCNEWSLNDNSLLEATREQHLFSQRDGLSLRSAGYEWLQVNKDKSNFVKVPAGNIQTLSSSVSTIFAVPSSQTSKHDLPLKELAKLRLKSRFDVSKFSSFDEAIKIRRSCHIIEQSGSDFLCDCHEGKDVYNRSQSFINKILR